MKFQLDALPETIGDMRILRIPPDISQAFPSRSLNMLGGTINGQPLVAPLEPDGAGSHMLLLEDRWVGLEQDKIHLDFDITPDWPEPEIPTDVREALDETGLMDTWHDLTVKARWEWLRWIRSTKVDATRRKRIAVAMSKLSQGDRRPCCFNSASCTIPELSKSGVLLQES